MVFANNRESVSDQVELLFNEVAYSVAIHVSDQRSAGEDAGTSSRILTVEVERSSDGEQWREDFTESWIEDITRKSGSYKNFEVFLRMLQTGLRGESQTVSVELLTYADLEMLRERMGSGRAASGQSRPPPPAVQNKRYLILTYMSDYDRVHYPLPLLYDASPDPARLRETIRRLRAELEAARGGAGQGALGTSRMGEVVVELRRMREENTNLRAQLRRFDSDAEAARGEAESRVRSDLEALARELRVVQRERDLLRDRCETAEAALEEASHRLKRTDASKRKAVERATEDVTSMREALREARARARSLQAEVDALLKPRTSSAPRSRASPSGRPGRAPPSAARPAGPASSSRPGSVPLRSREPRDPPRREPPHRTSARSSSSNPRSALSPLALERIQNRSRPWANATPSVGSRSRDSTPTRSPRFDPTAWVRQQREKEDEYRRRVQRTFTPPSSRPASRAPSRSATPPRDASAGRARHDAAPARRASRGPSPTAPRPAAAPGARTSARSASASPSRAVQALKDRLSSYTRVAVADGAGHRGHGDGVEAGRDEGVGAAGAAVEPGDGGSAVRPKASDFYQDVEDANERLEKLQAYIREAKQRGEAKRDG